MVEGEAGQHRGEVGTSASGPDASGFGQGEVGSQECPEPQTPGRAVPALVGEGRRVWAAAADPPSCAGPRR